MNLTPDQLAMYEKGQAELISYNESYREGYVLRGEIEKIHIHDGVLQILFAWLAHRVLKEERHESGEKVYDWHCDADSDREYHIALENIKVMNIGSGRYQLCSNLSNNFVTLFPRGQSRLCREKVHGFPKVQIVLTSKK